MAAVGMPTLAYRTKAMDPSPDRLPWRIGVMEAMLSRVRTANGSLLTRTEPSWRRLVPKLRKLTVIKLRG